MTRLTCKTCRFMWPVEEGAQVPTCRINPPTLVAVPVPVSKPKNILSPQGPQEQSISWLQLGAWPPTTEDKGCGKWEDKKLDS